MPWDVALDDDGDLPEQTRHITGDELTLQRVGIRLRTFLGEWILDQFKGLDYLGWTQQKPVLTQEITNLVQAEVQSTPGVDRVEDFEGEFVNQGGLNPTVRITGSVFLTTQTEVQLLAVLALSAGDSTPAVISWGRSGSMTPF